MSAAALRDPPLDPTAPQHATTAALGPLGRFDEPGRDRILVATLLALGAHLGLAWWAPVHVATHASQPTPVEIEFAPPPPPPPPPPPAAPAPAPTPPPAAAPPAPRAPAPKAPPPPAAAAPAVRTALPEPASAPEEPFDFTSDPHSTGFSSGVVAVGGAGTHGLAGAALGGTGTQPRRTPPPGDGLTPASDLSQSPKLRVADPCRGFFPSSAHDDVATALVRLVIDRQGAVSSATVLSESPSGQGFGAAARACMLEQRLSPALNRQGRAVATAVNVNVHFSR